MRSCYAILLVEDDLADIKITERAVKESRLPVQLIIARDGQGALDYLLRRGEHAARGDWRFPDLVLLDLNLPGLSGYEVLVQIRQSAALCTVPVVVFTTSGHLEDIRGAYEAGANTYIQKPQEFGRFVQVLQTIQAYWLDAALLPRGR